MSRTIRFIPLIAAVAVAGAVPAAAPAAKKKKVQCVKRTGDTVYRDRTLRVFRNVKQVKGDADAETIKISFCTPGTTKTPTLLTRFSNNLDESLTVSGVTRAGSRYLALEIDESTGTSDGTALWVYDISTRVRTFVYGSETGFEHRVTSDGGVALLEGGTLRGFDGAGERVLATGATAPAVNGNVVYWTAGGAAQMATLTGEGKRGLQP